MKLPFFKLSNFAAATDKLNEKKLQPYCEVEPFGIAT
jgi:hypothetical protein